MTQTEPIIERAQDLARSGYLRNGARLLRDRLAEDPSDNELRRALAQMYRDAGHLDQAGRYEFGMPYASSEERAVFLRHVIAIGADEESLRRLCLLPDHVAIPEDVTSQLARISRAKRGAAAWESVTGVGGVAFAITSLVTVLAVYVIVVVGGDVARPVARVGGVASLAALVIVTFGVGMSYWVEGSRKAALGWNVATAVLSVAVVLGAIATFGAVGES
ncbi:hypothetical protein LJR045_001089 [Microbacterium sp. LjRoot45]|uniref:hypothetical protein n=1 Tax=Microbacterium sp. LjRoot45 TaxID=3342329 RepID=UPI003ECD0204